MTAAPLLRQRRLLIGAIALLTLIFLSLVLAPDNTRLDQGSTYSRAPDGYAAWYASLESQGLPVRRWRRPLTELLPSNDTLETPAADPEASPDPASPSPEPSDLPEPGTPITLVKIFPFLMELSSLDGFEQELAKDGSVVVLVGLQTPVTAAPFRVELDTPAGAVTLETRRRQPPSIPDTTTPRLDDEHGWVVWEQFLERGKIVFINTPFFAANAYQEAPGNFDFLTQLVSEAGHPIWVDEYLHGYRDEDVLQDEERGSLVGYLRQTPVVLVALQAAVLVVLAVWGDRRLGPPTPRPPKVPNSSAAYIHALGGVLEKAGSSEFVVALLGKAEQAHLQRALGLGVEPIDPQVLLQVWQTQSGQSLLTLQALLNALQQKDRMGERDLLIWLGKLQKIRQSLPGARP